MHALLVILISIWVLVVLTPDDQDPGDGRDWWD
jgi:hypothetical protein